MTIVYNKSNHIVELCLNNPQQHNVLDKTTIAQFCNYLSEVEQDPSVKVLIITASGDQTFCAGADLDEIKTGILTVAEFSELPHKIAQMNIPTICALNGDAFGGGTEIALCCDFRIGLAQMKLKVPAAELGVHYPARGVRRFQSILGINNAKRLLLLCETFGGTELFEMGYLTHLASVENLQDTAVQLAATIGQLDKAAIGAIKSAFEVV